MGLGACFPWSSRQDYYRQHDHDYSSPSTLARPHQPDVHSYRFTDWIKLRCLGGGSNNNNNNKKKRKAEAGDGRGGTQQPERVRKVKKKQQVGRGDDEGITLQECLTRSPSSRQLPLPNNKVYPNNNNNNNSSDDHCGRGRGNFSLEMLLEIGELADSAGVDHEHTYNYYNPIFNTDDDDDDDDSGNKLVAARVVPDGEVVEEGNWVNSSSSSSRKRRVSFKLPEEGDIFTYDPSDDDNDEEGEDEDEDEESLMLGVYYF